MKPSVEKGLASHSSIMVAPLGLLVVVKMEMVGLRFPPRKVSVKKRKSTRTNLPRIFLSFLQKITKMKFPLQLTPTSQAHPDHPGHPF